MQQPAKLPDFLQGWCVLPMAPGSLVPITALCLALAIGVLLRSRYDLAHRLPIGDAREHMRLILQAAATAGVFVVLLLIMYGLEGGWFLPQADRLGPLTRNCIGLLGGVLAARALVRLYILTTTPSPESHLVYADMRPDPDSGRIPEGAMPEMPIVVPPMPAPNGGALTRGDIAAFLGGVVMLGCAIAGWDTSSMCLMRFGTAMP